MTKSTRLGFIAAADEGDISGDYLDLDGSGTMFGLFTETELNMPFNRGVQWGVLKTSLSFSDFSHDGTRSAQGQVNNVSGIDTSVLQAGISYRAELFNGSNYKLAPFIGANYVKATTDSFEESSLGNSVNNSLLINEYTKDLFLVEAGLDGSWKPLSDKWGFTGMIKVQQNLGDDGTDIAGRFEGANIPFSVFSPGCEL